MKHRKTGNYGGRKNLGKQDRKKVEKRTGRESGRDSGQKVGRQNKESLIWEEKQEQKVA